MAVEKDRPDCNKCQHAAECGLWAACRPLVPKTCETYSPWPSMVEETM